MDPDICFGIPIPVISDLVSVCVDFYNMVYTKAVVSGCVQLQFDVIVNIADVDLGCFVIPISEPNSLSARKSMRLSK